jgi:hypothetical protein
VGAERIDHILTAFDATPREYCEAAVDEAVSIRDEIAPRLVAVLEEVAAAPGTYRDEGRMRHLYAATILGHFKEPGAHLPLIKAFTPKGQDPGDDWGDMLTEDLDRLLFQTCGGNVSAIKELIVDKSADLYVRSAAMNALDMAVLNGMAPREEAIALYGGLFSGAEADPASHFWDMLTMAATRLCPEELLPTIRKACEDGLVGSGYIQLEEVERAAKAGTAATLAESKRRFDARIHDDIHKYMSRWARFHPERELREERREQQEVAERQARQRTREKERLKKKMAKKAQRRNRN